MPQVFTIEEVAKHNTPTDCWIIIDSGVYNVTNFLSSHPGGRKVILNLAGKNATKEFHSFHNAADVLKKYGPQLYIGNIGSIAGADERSKLSLGNTAKVGDAFGNLVPYCDPNWYQEWKSPYYNDSHRRFRAAMREFVDREIIPFAHEWDESKSISKDLWEKGFKAGWLPGLIGPPWPTQYIGTHIAGNVKPEEFDTFHELILLDELSRCGSAGVLWGIITGLSIGLPPVMNFGSRQLQDKVCVATLTGRKFFCLCITEPGAGSDVANIQTTAKKTADGRHYIVNGEKKFITNGIWADYFTVAVRTGGPGMTGISFLLMERTMPGIQTRPMKCSGVWASGTAYVTFEDVKVPAENLIGQENQGFKYVMHNFNHERWGIVVQCSRFARVCYEDAFQYAHKRKTFGKRLIDHPVIRQKLGHMARQVEATHSWLETITFQLKSMQLQQPPPDNSAMAKIGGSIALLKAQSTQTMEFCAREAMQIFGGLAYTRGGQGERVERLYREVRAYAIAGGSEEIMLDLGVRQAIKSAKL